MEESGGSGLSGVLGGHHVEVQWDDVTQSFTFRLALSSGQTELIHFDVPLSQPALPCEEEEDVNEKEGEKGRESDLYEPAPVSDEWETVSCLNEVLPYELLSIILRSACGYGVMGVVVRGVCRLWRELVLLGDFTSINEKHPVFVDSASHGWVSLMQWALDNGATPAFEALLLAAQNGHLEVLKWAKAGGWILDTQSQCNICSRTAHRGHLEVLKWAGENNYVMDEMACAKAAEGGHLDVLKWLREQGCAWDVRTCSYAAKGGNMEVLLWAVANGCPVPKDEWDSQACTAAAIGGHWEALMWLREQGCIWDEWVCAGAAYGGHLELLMKLREHGCEWDRYTCMLAAGQGNIELLNWAWKNGCGWDMVFCFRHTEDWDGVSKSHLWSGSIPVAQSGNLDLLMWTIEEGVWLDRSNVMFDAAKGGSVEILNWLHNAGYPWDKSLAYIASEEGCLPVLIWASEHGCDLDRLVVYNAGKQGHLDILKWAREQGCPWHDEVPLATAKEGHWDVMKWAIANGCGWQPEVGTLAATQGKMDILQWAKEECALDVANKETLQAAIEAGQLGVVKWCYMEGVEMGLEECALAAKHGALEVLKWLRKKEVPWDLAVLKKALKRKHYFILFWIMHLVE